MTGADFTGVDIDLLADYVGGALADTPDEARVAALIAADPAWRDAHATLSDGMAEVGDALLTWGAAPEPMPADVVARLDAALHAPTTRHLTVVRETGGDRAARPRPRVFRRAAPFAAAAAVLGLAGVGFASLGGSDPASDTATSTAAGRAGKMAPELRARIPQTAAITTSGLDYDPATIAAGAPAPLVAQDDGATTPPTRKQDTPRAATATMNGLTDELGRLRPSAALQACLDAIGAENGVGAITVQTVDFAKFAGIPALIVHFTASNGSWAWASGPGCGLPGAGAATRYSVQVR